MRLSPIIFIIIAFSSINSLCADIQVEIQEAHRDSYVSVVVKNQSDDVVRLWQQNYSQGWGNWTLEFLGNNVLTVYVRRPNAGFSKEIAPPFIEIPKQGSRLIEFKLDDKTWVSHRIQMWPANPTNEDIKNAVRGCIAILGVPQNRESARYNVWTGKGVSP